MSEYWKSTPKYWCKHCKDFVKDTKIERQNHEATGKHQGNLQRFIRGLHKDNEREQREKQRAKDEVNRLNGVARSSPLPTGGMPSASSSAASGNRNLTPADRKRQLQQLADMGIAVPEDFRRETAMAGEWSVTSTRIIHEDLPEEAGLKKEEPDDDTKGPVVISFGVRKRKNEVEEEEDQLGSKAPRKGWGSSVKSLPGAGGGADLDALLSQAKPRTIADSTPKEEAAATPTLSGAGDSSHDPKVSKTDGDGAAIKQEDVGLSDKIGDDTTQDNNFSITNGQLPSNVGDEAPAEVPPVFFKKRKSKKP